MIDTHVHLSDNKYADDTAQVVERATLSGVSYMICPSVNLRDAQNVLRLTEDYPNVYGLAGIYPGEAVDNPNWQDDLLMIAEILKNNPKMVGVGEVGLDEASYRANPKLEETVLRAQIELALAHDYPVVIHARNTQEPLQLILDSYPELRRVHIHCMSGTTNWLEYVLSRGYYVGFDGNVTYKNAENLREHAKKVPLSQLLLETDSPYLPPDGHRGERNEPGNVKITASFLANLRGETIEQLAEATSTNAQRLFDL